MSKIESELLEVVNLPEKKNEKRQDFLARLARAVAKVEDPVWEQLSMDAKDWNNAAATRLKSGGTIVEFSDFDENADDHVQEEPASKPKAAKQVKPDPKIVGRPRKTSACHSIKKLVVAKPSITVAELSEKLKSDGLKVSDVTIATLRSDLRDTLRVLNEVGMGEFQL
jgi:hypothetical protein